MTRSPVSSTTWSVGVLSLNPEAHYLGIADGATSNWRFLEQPMQRRKIDFFHATEYVDKIAQALYPQHRDEAKRAHRHHEHCKKLKSDPNALDLLIGEAACLSPRSTLSQQVLDGAISAWTYFTNIVGRHPALEHISSRIELEHWK